MTREEYLAKQINDYRQSTINKCAIAVGLLRDKNLNFPREDMDEHDTGYEHALDDVLAALSQEM